jgi:transcriptional regulator with XRE-family HTH domain
MLEILEMSSALGEHLRECRERAGLTQDQLAGRSKGVARSTVSAIEQGVPVKLETIRLLADALQLNREEWTTLLIDWLRIELGDEFDKLDIRLRDGSELRDADTVANRLRQVVNSLTPSAQQQILKAAERPEIRDVLPALNRIYEERQPPQRYLPTKAPPAKRSKRSQQR